MRAVMPGFVNYWYKDGKLPERTKASFNTYNILTVHNIVVLNALLFLFKINHFPDLLPKSIRHTIPLNAPRPGYDYEVSREWSEKYNDIPYRASFFP